MYQNPIYTIKESGERSFLIELNPEHRIFAAHFPGKPVLPGACIIEIFNHLMKVVQSDDSRLVHIRQIKFLKMIEPDMTRCVRFSFDPPVPNDGCMLTKATVTSADGTELFAKLSASYAAR